MKIALIFISLLTVNIASAQSEKNNESIKNACLDYIEGFYEGDTLKIKRSIKPSLHKFGFLKDKSTGEYKAYGYMTFDKAIAYALRVKKNNQIASKDAPKQVEILDVMNTIASAKITAWWGVDYILLSKNGDKWMIEQVLWEGPLQK